MATFVMNDAFISINSVDLSDHVKRVTLNYESETADDTHMSDNTRIMQGGLKNWGLEVEFSQDFASGEVDATLFSLVGTTTTIIVRPTSDAVSATNPNFTGTALLTDYPPLAGSIGEHAQTTASFVAAGDLSRATS